MKLDSGTQGTIIIIFAHMSAWRFGLRGGVIITAIGFLKPMSRRLSNRHDIQLHLVTNHIRLGVLGHKSSRYIHALAVIRGNCHVPAWAYCSPDIQIRIERSEEKALTSEDIHY